MTTLVADIPLWVDCPFAAKLPEWVEARRGEVEGHDSPLFVLADKQHRWHVDMHYEYDADIELNWLVCLNSLNQRMLAAEYPGMFPGIYKRIAEAQLKCGPELSELEVTIWLKLQHFTAKN